MADRRNAWTIEDVAVRFEEAASTARRLPPVRVQGYFNCWPAIKRMSGETSARNRRSTAFLPTLLPSNGCWKSCAGSNGWRRNTGTRLDAGQALRVAGHHDPLLPATARRHGGTGSGIADGRRPPQCSTSMSRCAHSQYAPRSET